MKHLHGFGQLLTAQLPEFLHEPLDHIPVCLRFLPFNEQSFAALYMHMAAVSSEEMWITYRKRNQRQQNPNDIRMIEPRTSDVGALHIQESAILIWGS